MDVLSEVLRVVRMSGAIHFVAELRHPWAFAFSSHEMLAARLKLPHGSVTPFHVFIEGGCHVVSGAIEPFWVERGDVVVFPRADAHVLTSEPGLGAVPIKDVYSEPSSERITVLQYGGDGLPSRFICGFLHLDQMFDPLLDSLPTVLCIRSRENGVEFERVGPAGRAILPVTQRREAKWWRASVDYLIEEVTAPEPGHQAVLARLTEALFVQVLRWQMRPVAAQVGWLGGLHDAQIGRVLALIHADPKRAWRVEELSEAAAMSRSAFAKRFVELVGQSPIHYLASWRMHLARNLLRETTLGLAEIGGRLGYRSEAAFSRAFSREIGTPPASWRAGNGTSGYGSSGFGAEPDESEPDALSDRLKV
jgi:AraC family transcriptional regulator, alkane utilization regulator